MVSDSSQLITSINTVIGKLKWQILSCRKTSTLAPKTQSV